MTDSNKVVQLHQVNVHQIFINDGIEQFQYLCRTQPDLVPTYIEKVDNTLSYLIGYWWLSLDEGQKTKSLKEHTEFAEKYSLQTCKTYATICKKIPTSIRMDVVKSVSMKVSQIVTDSTSDEDTLNILFTLAITTGISARNMHLVIDEWKKNKELGLTLIDMLPNVLEGDRKDKGKIESLVFELKRNFQKALSEKQSEIILLASKSDVSKQELTNLEVANRCLKQEVKNLQSELEKLDKKQIEQIKQEIQIIEKEKQVTETVYIETENQSTIEELKRVKKQLEEERIKNTSLQGANEELNEENYNKEREITGLKTAYQQFISDTKIPDGVSFATLSIHSKEGNESTFKLLLVRFLNDLTHTKENIVFEEYRNKIDLLSNFILKLLGEMVEYEDVIEVRTKRINESNSEE